MTNAKHGVNFQIVPPDGVYFDDDVMRYRDRRGRFFHFHDSPFPVVTVTPQADSKYVFDDTYRFRQ